MLFLCLHWCCSSSRCYHLQISLTHCLYSLFQVINNKDTKSGSTYLPLHISLGTCSQLFNTASCNSSAHMTVQFKSTEIFSYQHLWERIKYITERSVYNIHPTASHISKFVFLFKCGRIRFDWLKVQIILVWLLSLSLFSAYYLSSITWSLIWLYKNQDVLDHFWLAATQRHRSCTWIAPQIHLVHDLAAGSNQQLVSRQKLEEKY